jgi:hypothetical protein
LQKCGLLRPKIRIRNKLSRKEEQNDLELIEVAAAGHQGGDTFSNVRQHSDLKQDEEPSNLCEKLRVSLPIKKNIYLLLLYTKRVPVRNFLS